MSKAIPERRKIVFKLKMVMDAAGTHTRFVLWPYDAETGLELDGVVKVNTEFRFAEEPVFTVAFRGRLIEGEEHEEERDDADELAHKCLLELRKCGVSIEDMYKAVSALLASKAGSHLKRPLDIKDEERGGVCGVAVEEVLSSVAEKPASPEAKKYSMGLSSEKLKGAFWRGYDHGRLWRPALECPFHSRISLAEEWCFGYALGMKEHHEAMMKSHRKKAFEALQRKGKPAHIIYFLASPATKRKMKKMKAGDGSAFPIFAEGYRVGVLGTSAKVCPYEALSLKGTVWYKGFRCGKGDYTALDTLSRRLSGEDC